jgi:hypothetical protein
MKKADKILEVVCSVNIILGMNVPFILLSAIYMANRPLINIDLLLLLFVIRVRWLLSFAAIFIAIIEILYVAFSINQSRRQSSI